ncbi:MAG: HAD-IIIA family hydrolase [Phycisphaerales bacterium]|jgi:3-deoxy-D-manno-octulosonate 8-phosphate phosphatase (KDO 8-P phosphatase)|nr:HAD-IIIA family hydrolase [Phycisphaerales bacterium]
MNNTDLPDLTGIKLLVLDVDGVMTDGRIMLTGNGDEIKVFNVRDGAGMKYWKRVGGRLAIITGRGCQAVQKRASELDVDFVRMHAKDKLPVLLDVLEEMNLTPDQVAVIGDDLTDVPMARVCRFSAAPADAVDELKSVATYTTKLPGGAGCVREVIELLLKAAGTWPDILKRYFPDDEETD